jgi:cysteine desulfuration protein SufE
VAEQTAEGRWRFHSDCDSPLVRALVHLLCQSFEGVTAAEAATAEVTVLDQLDLTRNLSPTRLDGLKAVREQIAATVTTSQKP